MQRFTHVAFFLLVLIYLGLGFLYATKTPAWQAPDEPAHYNYIRQLAAGALPLMEAGDYDQAYQGMVIGSRFDPQYAVDSFEYEDYQPPLYYLTLTPSYQLADGGVVALRLTSVLVGLGVVVFAYLSALNLFPHRPWLALTVAAFVALLPQHLSILSAINNDSLAELIVAALLYTLTRPAALTFDKRTTRTVALLLGLAFLTKVTAYLMAGAVGLYLLWQLWGDWRRLWRVGLQIFVPALLIGFIWWGRNLSVYGGLDFLGTQAHDAIVVGQPTTQEWVAQFGLGEVLSRFFRTSFQSFYGQFGWMCCPMPSWAYFPLRLMTFAGIAGALWWLVRFRPKSPHKQAALVLFSNLLGLNFLLYIVYNFSFVQHQGRYFFVSLIPIGTAMTIGLDTWLRPLTKQIKPVALLLPLTLILGLSLINLYIVFYILPCGLAFQGC
ncbi:MAG: DUF2142 domain-containing protein [Candidatus Promineifilaceae bacterium]